MTTLSAELREPLADDSGPLLEIRHARKSYGSVIALEDVSLAIRRREIVALLGDNGAGKSTLTKAISGAHQLDAGEILFEGRPAVIQSPADARALGIETLFQDLALFDNLSAVANFFLGREFVRPTRAGPLGILDERAMAAEWAERLDRLGVRIQHANQPIGLMSGGQRQAVAVTRAVAFATHLLILDEPTAALGVRESQRVLELVRRLPEHGVSVLLISHNLDHVLKVADRAIVLRHGREVGEAPASTENHELLVSLIVGGGEST